MPALWSRFSAANSITSITTASSGSRFVMKLTTQSSQVSVCWRTQVPQSMEMLMGCIMSRPCDTGRQPVVSRR